MVNKANCQCKGEHCLHHGHLQPCPNEWVPPVSLMWDARLGQAVPNSEYGFCELCWKSQDGASDE